CHWLRDSGRESARVRWPDHGSRPRSAAPEVTQLGRGRQRDGPEYRGRRESALPGVEDAPRVTLTAGPSAILASEGSTLGERSCDIGCRLAGGWPRPQEFFSDLACPRVIALSEQTTRVGAQSVSEEGRVHRHAALLSSGFRMPRVIPAVHTGRV